MLDNWFCMHKQSDTVIQAIIVVSSVFVLMAVFIIAYILYFNKRKTQFIEERIMMGERFRQQLFQSQIEVQEQTFQQIGKELHDNVGQLLSTAKILLGLTERGMENPPDTLLTAHATLAQAINELRSLSKSLDKEWLEQFSFLDNLRSEISRINIAKVVYAEFHFADDLPLWSDGQIILFRIVQEAIQNAIKHAHPKTIIIKSGRSESSFRISIADDGKGFGAGQTGAGQGITNMKHRTVLLGGTIKWDSAPDTGTVVTITLPYKKDV